VSGWLRGHLSNPICAAFPKLFLLFGPRVICEEREGFNSLQKQTQRGKRKFEIKYKHLLMIDFSDFSFTKIG
jgi:hypothetical protein